MNIHFVRPEMLYAKGIADMEKVGIRVKTTCDFHVEERQICGNLRIRGKAAADTVAGLVRVDRDRGKIYVEFKSSDLQPHTDEKILERTCFAEMDRFRFRTSFLVGSLEGRR